MLKEMTRQEYLEYCQELREDRLDQEALRRYWNGIVLASRTGNRFLEPPKDEGKFFMLPYGKYKRD